MCIGNALVRNYPSLSSSIDILYKRIGPSNASSIEKNLPDKFPILLCPETQGDFRKRMQPYGKNIYMNTLLLLAVLCHIKYYLEERQIRAVIKGYMIIEHEGSKTKF